MGYLFALEMSPSTKKEQTGKTKVVVDFSKRPFRVFTDSRTVEAESVIVATGAVAKRLPFTGSGDGPDGYWNRGISAWVVCDGAAPIFRNKPLAVIGGGDSAMEEARSSPIFAPSSTINFSLDPLGCSACLRSYNTLTGAGKFEGLKDRFDKAARRNDVKAIVLTGKEGFMALAAIGATTIGSIEVTEQHFCAQPSSYSATHQP
ncbi:thioredoxin reductase-like [Gastrolobium bilobum]|uniref:thioredoxin reductase-like n=1 Tax=Gastrolobium bilobum TaxID=150636 RepID=UPI002AB05D57|nr:thioredoxin reductase-like [Gastrolobium bilobum]